MRDGGEEHTKGGILGRVLREGIFNFTTTHNNTVGNRGGGSTKAAWRLTSGKKKEKGNKGNRIVPLGVEGGQFIQLHY